MHSSASAECQLEHLHLRVTTVSPPSTSPLRCRRGSMANSCGQVPSYGLIAHHVKQLTYVGRNNCCVHRSPSRNIALQREAEASG
jgi:hypothetical protein